MQDIPEQNYLHKHITALNARQLKDIRDLVHALRHVLMTHDFIPDEEVIRYKVEMLEYWVEFFHQGDLMINEIPVARWLSNLRDHLELTLEEMTRSSERNQSISKEKVTKIEEIKVILSTIERITANICPVEQEPYLLQQA